MPPIKASLAEFVGTFALMFAGGGAIIVTGGDNLVAIAFAHGLILAVMVSATMHISGGQINPAVSIALGLVGKQPWSKAGIFIVAQVLGAVVAAFLLKTLLAGAYEVGNVGATLGEFSRAGGENYAPIKVLGLEAIATFFLMFVVIGTAVDQRGIGRTAAIGGLGIGLTLTAAILCIGPATGASLNPARSFGPALVAGAWTMHWAYWVGPIVGAALAAFAYKLVFGEE
ncbi:MAG: MIP/aquaporin family protein [Planctomycetota bacterium]|jgi:MIP family channel proteins